MKALLILALCLTSTLLASAKPNFLMIYADDLGYGDVSTYGKSDAETPNTDRLAKDGMLFTQMRANCTVCTPSRAALLTGIYADRAGAPGVIRTDPKSSFGYLDPSVPTLADKLKSGGYKTALIGKWHLGLESPNIPNERGFDHFHGFLGDMMDSYYTHRRGGKNFMRLNSETIDPKGQHATELFSEWACDYLRDQKGADKPFFLFLSYNAPHYPIEPPKEWFEKTKARSPELSPKRAGSVAFVEHLDHYIGTILDTLKETGLEKNTVVVFASDNGGSIPHAQNNDPWRGGKQDHYDGGLKVPFTVTWPGKIKPGTSDYQGLVFDVFPTFLELAKVDPAPDLDAKSLIPILRGDKMEGSRDLYFVRREGGKYAGKAYHAVIRDGWKLMQNDPFSPMELYHLSEDPKEQNDLAEKEKAKVDELKALMDKQIAIGGATPWRP